MKRAKKRIVKFIVIVLILVPCSAFALFGSENVVLTAMLTELKAHTLTLFDLFDSIYFIDSQVANMRDGIEDFIELRNIDLIDRDQLIDDLIPSSDILYDFPLIHGIVNYEDTLDTIEGVWGKNLDTAYGETLRFKDFIPTYALGQAALIADEAKAFARTGRNLLEDLEFSTEGKATLRSAQAGALQVQQLAQIESNQALQLSLQSQQVLSDNQIQKGFHEFSGVYLNMLRRNYRTLAEE